VFQENSLRVLKDKILQKNYVVNKLKIIAFSFLK